MPQLAHCKKWLVSPSIDQGKLEFQHTGKTWRTTVYVYQHGKTTMNIICGCFTMLVNLNIGFSCFTSV